MTKKIFNLLEDKGATEEQLMYVGQLLKGVQRPSVHIAEIFSPPRITRQAMRMGLSPGFALDLSVPDPSGRVWDFSKAKCRDAAERILRAEKPLLLVGCPPCTACSQLQQWSFKNMPQDKVKKLIEEAKAHV